MFVLHSVCTFRSDEDVGVPMQVIRSFGWC